MRVSFGSKTKVAALKSDFRCSPTSVVPPRDQTSFTAIAQARDVLTSANSRCAVRDRR
jgi:hypothetical protein